MLHKLTIGLVISVAALSVAPLLVGAQEDEPVTTQTMTTQAVPVSEEVSGENAVEQRDARVKAIKDKSETKISAAEEKRVAGKCKSAQTIVGNLQTRMNTVVEKRREKYTEVTSKLQNLVEKLKLANVDTTELEAAIVDIETEAAAAVTQIELYNTNLDDLATMDCESDPAAFIALIEAARTQRKEIISSHGNFKSRINETVKPILQGIRESIQLSNTAGEGEGQ